MILEEVYEEEFYDFSYGFRPRRSAHQALASLREQCVKKKVKWILEVDIKKFFDKVDHREMRLRNCFSVKTRINSARE